MILIKEDSFIMYRKNYSLGVVLILVGVLLLFNQVFNLHILGIGNLWPLFILVPGLIFEFGYFSTNRNPGLLVPGGILTTIGTLFLFLNYTTWGLMKYAWPVFPLAVAIGLFQLYVFGFREKGLLIPVFILSAISIISFVSILFNEILWWIDSSFIFPAILILVGAAILFKNFGEKR